MADAGESRTVFVGNLTWNTTDDELRNFMSAAGTVLSAHVQTHADSGRSKGWGLVEFATESEAQNAISLLNNRVLGGRGVHVRMDRKNIETSGGFTVFVGNLPWSTTDEQLAAMFQDYQPYDAHVKTNMAGRSRGFGILRFATTEQGLQAISDMNGREIDGRAIQVREDRDRQEREGGAAGGGGRAGRGEKVGGRSAASAPLEASDQCTVFVGNLAWSTTDHDLFQHFSQIGGVQSAVVQMAPNGRSKGWGLVVFSHPDKAQLAINTLNDSTLHDRKLTIRLDRK